jgi:hypothetical protein
VLYLIRRENAAPGCRMGIGTIYSHKAMIFSALDKQDRMEQYSL